VLPTQHRYCAGISRRSAKDNCEWRTYPRSLRGRLSGSRTHDTSDDWRWLYQNATTHPWTTQKERSLRNDISHRSRVLVKSNDIDLFNRCSCISWSTWTSWTWDKAFTNYYWNSIKKINSPADLCSDRGSLFAFSIKKHEEILLYLSQSTSYAIISNALRIHSFIPDIYIAPL